MNNGQRRRNQHNLRKASMPRVHNQFPARSRIWPRRAIILPPRHAWRANTYTDQGQPIKLTFAATNKPRLQPGRWYVGMGTGRRRKL